jgi:Spy/CpxP family protein refolding chaperone
MMKSSLAAMLLTCILTMPTTATAQNPAADVTDMQALGAAVKADKRAFVAATLGLTDAEAKKFWPIYDAYQRSLEAANRIRAVAIQGLLSRDRPVTDLYAKQLAADLIASDEAEVKARRTLYKRVMRALPSTKAARYLQLESKVRALQNYDLAVAFPLIKVGVSSARRAWRAHRVPAT